MNRHVFVIESRLVFLKGAKSILKELSTESVYFVPFIVMDCAHYHLKYTRYSQKVPEQQQKLSQMTEIVYKILSVKGLICFEFVRSLSVSSL